MFSDSESRPPAGLVLSEYFFFFNYYLLSFNKDVHAILLLLFSLLSFLFFSFVCVHFLPAFTKAKFALTSPGFSCNQVVKLCPIKSVLSVT